MKGHRWFAALYDTVNRTSERRILAPLRARLLGDLHGTVLEIGPGTGFSFPYYPGDVTLIAAEPDRYMLRRAMQRARHAGPAISFVQCVAEALPFRDRTFDAVTATAVF
jgi:ubiquinone/menaquinone biosynthesis C-methylase UbiE